MLKHGSAYRLSRRSGTGERVISIAELRGHEEIAEIECDPIDWLTAGFVNARAAFEKPGGVLESGEWRHLRDDPGGRTIAMRAGDTALITIDPQTGNIASVATSGSDFRDELTLQWELQHGVWMPVELTRVRIAPDGSTLRRRIRIVSSMVNEPIDPREWSLATIGARDGDLIRDELRDVRFVFHGDPDAETTLTPVSAAAAMRTILLNVTAWIVILGLIMLSGRRRTMKRCSAGVE